VHQRCRRGRGGEEEEEGKRKGSKEQKVNSHSGEQTEDKAGGKVKKSELTKRERWSMR
jgi:hypothetical protein